MMRTKRTRRGFTLVEVLVAAALAIWGMWLITWLYQQGLESFRQAHAQSELTTQLRMTKTIMQRDLSANHFLSDDTKPNYGRRLSDQRTDLAPSGYLPPKAGFFRAGSPSTTAEQTDTNGFASWLTTNHFLQFTAILPGGSDSQVFSATIPAGSQNTYFGTAAEIMYYLQPSGLTTPTGNALYSLYRKQRISALTPDDATGYNNNANHPTQQPDAGEVMVINSQTSPATIATLGGLTIPAGIPGVTSLRLTSPPNGGPAANTARYGEDKLLANVLSFEVKFTGPPVTTMGSTWPTPFANSSGTILNSDSPYDFLPGDGYYDTFSTQVPNWQNYVASSTNTSNLIKPIRITGVQIHIRAYDPKTRATRQTTFIVDL